MINHINYKTTIVKKDQAFGLLMNRIHLKYIHNRNIPIEIENLSHLESNSHNKYLKTFKKLLQTI